MPPHLQPLNLAHTYPLHRVRIYGSWKKQGLFTLAPGIQTKKKETNNTRPWRPGNVVQHLHLSRGSVFRPWSSPKKSEAHGQDCEHPVTRSGVGQEF